MQWYELTQVSAADMLKTFCRAMSKHLQQLSKQAYMQIPSELPDGQEEDIAIDMEKAQQRIG